MVECKSCGAIFQTDKSLHSHLKAHNISVENYYHLFYPRYDLLTHELINFKDKQKYFETDFNSKSNFKKWILSTDKQEAKDYCLDLLVKRKNKKNVLYSFSQTELKSIGYPGIKFLDELFEGYYEVCEKAGFLNKYLDFKSFSTLESLPQNFKILIDTREQKPLKFEINTEIKKLNYGDYACSNQEISGNCFIERKSLSDFVGTMSSGFERFCKEVERAAVDNADLVVVVESNFQTSKSFDYLPHIKRHTKINSDFIFHNVRHLLNNYKNIQFLFAEGRPEATRLIQRIFSIKDISKKYDLELLYDLGKI